MILATIPKYYLLNFRKNLISLIHSKLINYTVAIMIHDKKKSFKSLTRVPLNIYFFLENFHNFSSQKKSHRMGQSQLCSIILFLSQFLVEILHSHLKCMFMTTCVQSFLTD